MKRFPMFAIFVTIEVLLSMISDVSVGYTVQCSNGNCAVHAASSPLHIFMGPAFLSIIMLIPLRDYQYTDDAVGFMRRVGAVYFDVILLTVCFVAIFALPSLFVESLHLNMFQWEFSRSYVRTSDWVISFWVFGVFLAGFLYMRRSCNKSNRPTFGQYLMGYGVNAGKASRFRYG